MLQTGLATCYPSEQSAASDLWQMLQLEPARCGDADQLDVEQTADMTCGITIVALS